MARTPTPKRKASAKPGSQRSDKVAILVRLPPDLAGELTAVAAAEDRPRSKMIEIAVRQLVQAHQRRTAA